MWLTDTVALVGSGDIGGMGITHPLDCHVYLLDGGTEMALIDAGSGFDAARIVEQIDLQGVDIKRVNYLLLTHGHFDHAGGAHPLAQLLGLTVVCGAETARMLSSGDEIGTGLATARANGLYPADAHLLACPVDIVLEDNETLRMGEHTITAIASPGHSHDHMAYWLTDASPVLFAGDTVFAGGRIALQALPDCRLDEYFDTVRRLAALPVAVLLPGHGLPILRNGGAHLRRALDCIDRLQMPPAMVF